MTTDRLVRIVLLRLRTLVRRDAVERDLDDELLYHLEEQTLENIRRGMSPDAAAAAARRALGNLALHKEAVRDTRGTRWIEELARDMAFAARSLRHARTFAITVVVTLALGIGANTAMFTLLRGTLLRPLPNRDGGRLVYLRQSTPGAGGDNVLFSVPEVADLGAGTRTLSALAEFSSALPFTLVGSDNIPVRVRAGIISGNYFDVLGLEPAIGRLTRERDDGASAAPIVVLSHRYWTDHFGGDSGIVGRTVRVNDRIATVVGVVQPAPSYPQASDIFVNTVTSPHHLSATMVTERTHRMTEVFARLAPTATLEQAREEIERITTNGHRDHPEAYAGAAQYAVSLTPLRDALNARAALTFWLLMGAAAFVLLIACANVANLTLMRGIGREREMLVRTALGAGRGRLRRLLVAENLTLAVVGGALGVLVALAAHRLIVAFAAQLSPRASEIRIDGVVLAVCLATSVVTALVLAFVPRIGGERTLAASLAPSGRRSTLGRGSQRVQRSLVVAQVAICMVLLTGAGLLARTLSNLQAVERGVRTDHALSVDLPLAGDLLAQVPRRAENLGVYERIRDRVAALPGVSIAALSSVAPLRSSMVDFDVKAERRAVAPNEPRPHAVFKTVDPGYFTAAGIPVRRGRAFASTDRWDAPRVAVLSQSLATQLFGDENPIGRRVAWTGEVLRFTPLTDEWRTVVGVVADTRDRGPTGEATPILFQPFAQSVVLGGALVVRTAADPAALQPAVVRAIREVAPRQIVERVATLEQVEDETVAPRRLNALFIASFGTLALVIALVGIAGVLAFSVSSRTAEIGIRMSLGADAGRVRRMVLGEGGTLLVLGLVLGTAGALVATRLLESLLFGVTPHDPVTLGTVAAGLTAVGVIACWIPAARAARIDPAVALRAE